VVSIDRWSLKQVSLYVGAAAIVHCTGMDYVETAAIVHCTGMGYVETAAIVHCTGMDYVHVVFSLGAVAAQSYHQE
jgi:hypothetical protein